MRFVRITFLLLISLSSLYTTQSYGGEKESSNFFVYKAYKTYKALKRLSHSVLYPLNYIFHVIWYKISKPTEETLYQAMISKNSIATQIILTYPIDPNYTHNHYYLSLLDVACLNKDLQAVEKLLSFDQIDHDSSNKNNKYPLLFETYKNAVSETYIKAEFDPTALKIIEALIKHPKTDVNYHNNRFDFEGNVLKMACRYGHTAIVKLLLERPEIEVNAQLPDRTPLHEAHIYGHQEIFNMLCDHPKIDPLEIFKIAIQDGNVALVENLLKNNLHKTIVLTNWHKAYESTLSNREKNKEIIKMLIKDPGTNVNYIKKDEHHHQISVLFWACKEGHQDIVELLLTQKDIEINNKYDSQEYNNCLTCLRIAHKKGHQEIFDLLCHHPTIDPTEFFAIALENSYEKIIKNLLEEYPLSKLEGPNRDCLQKAVIKGNVNIFKLLLKYHSVRVNHTAYNAALYEAVKSDNEAFVRLLLEVPNIDITQKNYSKEPPFFLAIRNGNISIAQLLHNHTNKIINERYNTNTPLIFAAKGLPLTKHQIINTINFLIDLCGANLSSKDDTDATFFYYLASVESPLKLEELTFFKKYNDVKKKQFLNKQLESFARIKFSDPQEINIQKTLYTFIKYCKEYGGDLDQRHNNHNRAVDTAQEMYAGAAQYISSNSKQFIIKEKIYHAFLSQTNSIPEHELHFGLNKKLGLDIKNIIMRYYYAVTIDQQIIADECYKSDYFTKNNSEKNKYKQFVLNKKYKQLGYPIEKNFFI